METIKTQIDHDTTLSDLRSTIIKGWPANRRSVNPCIRHYWAMRDLLSVEDGIVLMSERVIIPLPSRKSILETIHSGHQGITKNQLLAKTTVYWPNINQDIENFVNNCEVCQQALPSQSHEPLHQHPIPERAWQVLGTDLFNWNNKDFLIIVDYYSKFSYIRKLSTTTSAMVAEQTKQILSESGIPQRVISDNGPQFTGEAYQQFVCTWEIEHVTSSPRYPMSNGMVERAIRTVKNTLDKARKSGVDPYLAMLSIQATPISDKLPSPAELLLGRKLQINLPSYVTPPANREITRQQLTQRQQSQAFYHDRHARQLRSLAPGDPITVKNPITSKWDRAFVVSRSDKPRSYIIQTEGGGRYRRNRRHLRPRSFEARNTPTAPDTMAIQHREPVVGETCTKVGRLSKPPVRYTDWI